MAEILIILIAVPLSCWLGEVILDWAVADAHRRGLLDYPTGRGSHDVPTPRVGGMAIAPLVIAAAFFGLLARGLARAGDASLVGAGLRALVLGGAVAAVVGYRDDITGGLNVRAKFIGQAIAAALAALLCGWLSGFCVWGITIPAWPPIAVALAFCWFMWIMNVVNFMDGMDGMVSVFAMTCLAGFALLAGVAAPSGKGEVFLVLSAMAGAFIAFHRRNVSDDQERKTFMGDCGSLFIGLALAVLAIALPYNAKTGAVDFTPAIVLFFPFLFDTTLTVARRARRGANVLEAHHEHLYQRHLELGDSHAEVRHHWTRVMIAHLILAAIIIVFGSGSFLGRLAFLATPFPMLRYLQFIIQREQERKTA